MSIQIGPRPEVRTGARRLRVALLLLLSPWPAAPAFSQGNRPAPLPELDLDKLYAVEEGSFQRLARRMMSLSGARNQGADYSYVRFEPFEAQWVRLPDDTRRDLGKWTFKLRGQAQVIGGDRMWTPRVGDVQQNVKELTVTAYPGKPRSLRFVFRVHASVEKGEGYGKTVTVLGREEIEVQLLQRPGEKSFRLVLDPLTFRKHQAMLASNWIAEEGAAAKQEGEEKQDKEGGKDADAGPEPPAPKPEAEQDPGSEVTLVRYFKADDREIIIGFRRQWSARGNQVVDGTLHIRLNSTLNTSLYYDVTTKAGKPGKVLAAFFNKGHRIW